VFELYESKESFLSTYNLNLRRVAYLLFLLLELLLLGLAPLASTGNKGMQILAIGLFGLSVFLSLIMLVIGTAAISVTFLRRQPMLFWVCATGLSFIPFLVAIIFGK
jgi:hypothetical protein